MNLNESKLSNESANHLEGPTMTTDLPLPSGGSGGSAGGIWGAGMTSQPQQSSAPQAWDMPWAGPPSGGGGSTTTYGPIYNPAAPPPSAAYGMSLYPGYGGQPPPSSSGSGSHRSNTRLMLAGSGSGSESASDGGRASSIPESDKSSLLMNTQGLRQGVCFCYFFVLQHYKFLMQCFISCSCITPTSSLPRTIRKKIPQTSIPKV